MISITLAGKDELPVICKLSRNWALENGTRGYAANVPDDLADARCYLARDGDALIGFAIGRCCIASGMSAAIPDGARYFELDELYVMPEKRNRGYGREIFCRIEEMVRREGVTYLHLITATKDYNRIFNFYIEKNGMTFWSAELFKAL